MELNFSNVRPSIMNWVIVGLMAVTFIALSKFVVNKYENPLTNALKPIINQA